MASATRAASSVSPLLRMALRRSGGSSSARGGCSVTGQLLRGGVASSSSSSPLLSAWEAAAPLGVGGLGPRRWMMSQGANGGGEGDEKKKEEEEAKAAEGDKAAAEPGDEKQKLIEKLQAENKDLKDKVLYTLAEMENVRTIARRDMESSKQFAIQSFAKQLLDVADNLSRALASVPAEALKKKEENALLVTLVEGVRMTDSQLQKVFGANKIAQYGAPGDKFDPHLHDALFEYEDASKEPGSVGQVLKTGYKLHDRVIRPAQVGTVKKSG